MKRNLVLILLSLLGTSMIAQSKEKPCMEDIKALATQVDFFIFT